jgi:hypothetical protein
MQNTVQLLLPSADLLPAMCETHQNPASTAPKIVPDSGESLWNSALNHMVANVSANNNQIQISSAAPYPSAIHVGVLSDCWYNGGSSWALIYVNVD